jgi:transposase InsO family protein
VSEDRAETLSLIGEAMAAGCRLEVACRELGIDPRTVQRWRRQSDGSGDRRKGPRSTPKQKFSPEERAAVLAVANAPEFRNLSPKQIVPQLADRNEYVASESSFYRILRAEDQMTHRGSPKPRSSARPEAIVAKGPNELWSWDITYLRSEVRGRFYYLYLIVDVWSRRIIKAAVHAEESSELAAKLVTEACREQRVEPNILTMHSDNGAPMKGSTMLATMQTLGIIPSFSRPSVSDDNPFSEALFRTLKYVPSYPRKPFSSLDAAWAWVERFVAWYNGKHLHSAIGFVTPDDRHQGKDIQVLDARHTVYQLARARHPERWSGATRQWDAPALVALNPRDLSTRARASSELRCGARSATSMVPQTTTPSAAAHSRHHHEPRVAA